MPSKGSGTRAVRVTPSGIRERIFDEHQRLRKSLLEVQGLARAATLDAGILPLLVHGLRAVVAELTIHIDSEDETLLPLLEGFERSGERSQERADQEPRDERWDDRVEREHRAQREILREMSDVLDRARDPHAATPSLAVLLAQAADGFVLRLLRGLRVEDTELDVAFCESDAAPSASVVA